MRQGIGGSFLSPQKELANGWYFAQLLHKLYGDVVSLAPFVDQTSPAVINENWNCLEGVLRQVGVPVTDAELLACRRGDETSLIQLLIRIYTTHTGKNITFSDQPERAITPEPTGASNAHRKLVPKTLSSATGKTMDQDPLKFLTNRNLDNLQGASYDATLPNMSQSLISDRPMSNLTARNLHLASLHYTDDLGGSSQGGRSALMTMDESRVMDNGDRFPMNVPKFARGSFLSTRKFLSELSTTCRNSLMSSPNFSQFIDMLDPRVDIVYPYPEICLRVAAEDAETLFESLMAELRPFYNLFIEQIVGLPILFWELLTFIIRTATNFQKISPRGNFAEKGVAYLVTIIRGVGSVSTSVLSLIYNNIIIVRLPSLIDLQYFGLYNYIWLYFNFLPILERETPMDIIQHILDFALANYKLNAGGQQLIRTNKLRLAILASIVAVIRQFFVQMDEDEDFLSYGFFAEEKAPSRGYISDEGSSTASPRQERSAKTLKEQIFLDILYVIVCILHSADTYVLDERVAALSIITRCCALNPKELLPCAETTILRILSRTFKRAKPTKVFVQSSSIHAFKPEVADPGPVVEDSTPVSTREKDVSTKSDSPELPLPKFQRRLSTYSTSQVPGEEAAPIDTSDRGTDVQDRRTPLCNQQNYNALDQSDSSMTDEGFCLPFTYDSLPYLNYSIVLAIVVLLRRLGGMCLAENYTSPIISISHELEVKILEHSESLSPVVTLIGILGAVGRNLELIKEVNEQSVEMLLNERTKPGYKETFDILLNLMKTLVRDPEMAEVIFAALDGKADFEQTIVIFPPDCYTKIVHSLYPGCELMQVIPGVLCVAVMCCDTFLAKAQPIEATSFFLAIARLLELMPQLSELTFTCLSDYLLTFSLNRDSCDTACGLLIDLIAELSGVIDDQDFQVSLRALIQYAFDESKLQATTQKKNLEVLRESQGCCMTLLHSLCTIPDMVSLLRDLFIRTDSEDYGNADLGQFIRSLLDEESGIED